MDGAIAWASAEITSDRTPTLFRYLVGYRPNRYGERELPALVPGMELDADAIVRRLEPNFLEAQSDAWMIQLYEWLTGQRALRDLRSREILRREDGEHVAAYDEDERLQIWLPPESETAYPVVRRAIAADEAASGFFRQLGLTEPDAVDEVLTSILPRYAQGRAEEGDYASDLERIAQALRVATGGKSKRLSDELREASFLIGRNAATGDREWLAPSALYEPTDELEIFLDGTQCVVSRRRMSAPR